MHELQLRNSLFFIYIDFVVYVEIPGVIPSTFIKNMTIDIQYFVYISND